MQNVPGAELSSAGNSPLLTMTVSAVHFLGLNTSNSDGKHSPPHPLQLSCPEVLFPKQTAYKYQEKERHNQYFWPWRKFELPNIKHSSMVGNQNLENRLGETVILSAITDWYRCPISWSFSLKIEYLSRRDTYFGMNSQAGFHGVCSTGRLGWAQWCLLSFISLTHHGFIIHFICNKLPPSWRQLESSHPKSPLSSCTYLSIQKGLADTRISLKHESHISHSLFLPQTLLPSVQWYLPELPSHPIILPSLFHFSSFAPSQKF